MRAAGTVGRGPLALVLDYGDVLSRPQSAEILDGMARRLGASPAAFRVAYRACRDSYDAGLVAVAAYWAHVAEALGRSLPASGAAWLIERDVASWTNYRDDAWALAREVHAGGRRTAILSNCPPEILRRIRADRALASWFDVVIASCEIGCNKPDPRIYRTCLSALAVPADRALFVDDRLVNLNAAVALGMQTFHFAGRDPLGRLRARLDET